ncbi:hypothetical protein NDU88_009342 [Pleurodeles waltl]|uniref:Uncharacterized protein n=1 Tax=Pleurodeles waltl TaxID=8319 RepID=A0AAV7PVP3_PLEWA|nr:hypothetical protein NDU88_009342 [Pleurodeles waltl]
MMGPIDKYPRGTLKNNIRFVGRANPEEEGCDDAQGVEKRTKKTPARGEDEKKDRPTSNDNGDAWREAKRPNDGRTEDVDAESEEAERAQEMDFPAEAESTKDNVTTHHIPGGTWLIQV